MYLLVFLMKLIYSLLLPPIGEHGEKFRPAKLVAECQRKAVDDINSHRFIKIILGDIELNLKNNKIQSHDFKFTSDNAQVLGCITGVQNNIVHTT